MIYVLPVIAAAALFALYKFLPNRKSFIYFCGALLGIFCISAFVQGLRSQQALINLAEMDEIRAQQKIFSDWYAAYQKDIDHLDHNWQLYHSLVETLKNADVYELSTYEQLSDLETDALAERAHIHALNVPYGLDEECSAAILEIIRKTGAYVDAQTKTISAARAAANPDAFINLYALNRRIKDLTIRESPAGLFTAAEISAIREKLTIPGEDD